jgi:hypothetical protein
MSLGYIGEKELRAGYMYLLALDDRLPGFSIISRGT